MEVGVAVGCGVSVEIAVGVAVGSGSGVFVGAVVAVDAGVSVGAAATGMGVGSGLPPQAAANRIGSKQASRMARRFMAGTPFGHTHAVGKQRKHEGCLQK